ncbi:hypothetical protein R70006_05400 [Paraburkholderia domus]|nr:hypothetical protein R70006_05400 [Paraburkholderia domus]CAE6949679.1 hypothetical protein R75471_05845 [Paraburkholderia domus]
MSKLPAPRWEGLAQRMVSGDVSETMREGVVTVLRSLLTR